MTGDIPPSPSLVCDSHEGDWYFLQIVLKILTKARARGGAPLAYLYDKKGAAALVVHLQYLFA